MLASKLTRKLSTFWKMPWHERLLIVHAFLLLPAIALTLTKIGLQTTQNYLIRLSPHVISANSPEQQAIAQRCSQLVNRAASYLFPSGNCLKRSLTLWFLLRRRGISSDLRIGVRRQDGEFQAHAWVEYNGQILNDVAAVRQYYSAFE